MSGLKSVVYQLFFLCVSSYLMTFFSCSGNQEGSRNEVLSEHFDSTGAPNVIAQETTINGPIPADSNEMDSADCIYYIEDEVIPEFQHDEGPKEFITNRIKNPTKLEGKVYVTFIVDDKGKVSEPSILKRISKDGVLEDSILANLKKMPDWKPGTIAGKPRRFRMHIPIEFKVRS